MYWMGSGEAFIWEPDRVLLGARSGIVMFSNIEFALCLKPPRDRGLSSELSVRRLADPFTNPPPHRFGSAPLA